jgi:hypothetical protein
MVASMFAA